MACYDHKLFCQQGNGHDKSPCIFDKLILVVIYLYFDNPYKSNKNKNIHLILRNKIQLHLMVFNISGVSLCLIKKFIIINTNINRNFILLLTSLLII